MTTARLPKENVAARLGRWCARLGIEVPRSTGESCKRSYGNTKYPMRPELTATKLLPSAASPAFPKSKSCRRKSNNKCGSCYYCFNGHLHHVCFELLQVVGRKELLWVCRLSKLGTHHSLEECSRQGLYVYVEGLGVRKRRAKSVRKDVQEMKAATLTLTVPASIPRILDFPGIGPHCDSGIDKPGSPKGSTVLSVSEAVLFSRLLRPRCDSGMGHLRPVFFSVRLPCVVESLA